MQSIQALSPEEREKRRRDAICAVLQKTDRILLGDVDLSVLSRDNAEMPPGWTTGTEIVVNMHHLPAVSDEDMIALWGLNYHELAHVMLTPRIRGKFRDLVRDREFRVAMNLAEDWRIETQFASLFEAADRYFKCTFKRLVIDGDKSDKKMFFPLAAGRAYLPTADRERWRREFVQGQAGKTPRDQFKPEQITELEAAPHTAALLDLDAENWSLKLRDLADLYVTASWSREDREHNQMLIRVIEQIKVLVPWADSEDAGNTGMPVADGDGMYGPDLPSSGQPQSDLEQDAAEAAMRVVARNQEEAKRISEMLADIENSAVSSGDSEGGDGGEGGEAGNQSDLNEVIVDPNQSINQDEHDGALSTSGHVSGGASRGGYTGASQHTSQLADEQREVLDRMFASDDEYDAMLTDEVRETLDSSAVQRDLKNMRRAVAEALGEGMHLNPEGDGAMTVAPADIRAERNRLARELKQLRAQLEGTYVNDQPSGKVHVRSWINACPAQRDRKSVV